MKTELIRIGNSRGIRIPKPLIEECGLGETVELRVQNDCLVVSASRKPREGWDDQFRAAGSPTRSELLLNIGSNSFDADEWQW